MPRVSIQPMAGQVVIQKILTCRMCYHVQLVKPFAPRLDWATIFEPDYLLEDEYNEQPGYPDQPAYHLNGFDHPDLPVITREAPHTIQWFQWGLIPSWAQSVEKAAELQNFTLNATCENLFDKPSFHESALKKRCIIIVGGFFENRHEGKLKYPYFIYPAKEPFFRFGGIYSEWANRETGEIVSTCAIITTPANYLMEKIHNTKKRMPLIFSKAQAQQWLMPGLTREEMDALMMPCDETMLQSHTVSRLINQSRQRNTNVPEVSDEVTYPELALLDS